MMGNGELFWIFQQRIGVIFAGICLVGMCMMYNINGVWKREFWGDKDLGQIDSRGNDKLE